MNPKDTLKATKLKCLKCWISLSKFPDLGYNEGLFLLPSYVVLLPSYVVLDYGIWVGYFTYFKIKMFFNLIKEINRLR